MDKKDLTATVLLIGMCGLAYFIGDMMGPVIGVPMSFILAYVYMRIFRSMFPLTNREDVI